MFYRAPTPARGYGGNLVDLENSSGAYGGFGIAGQLFVTPEIPAPPTVNVPEPPTWSLMALALAGLIFVRRMTRK